MIRQGPVARRGLRLVIGLWLTLFTGVVATSAGGQILAANTTLACSPQAPNGVTVGQKLLTGITTPPDPTDPTKLDPLNSTWVGNGVPAIEGSTIVLDRIHVPQGCNRPGGENVTNFCLLKLGFSHCQYTYVTMTLKPFGKPGDANYQPTISGLDALRFTGLTVPGVNERNISVHTNRGPDASVIADGVFAPEGSGDSSYYFVLPHNNTKKGALVIDLGNPPVSLCGVASNCTAPKIQADNDDSYHLDYSTDGITWNSLGTFAQTGGTGMHTRSLTGSTVPANFTARYVAVYVTSGGPTYAISELQLWSAANKLVTVGKPVIGPVPYVIYDGATPEEGHSAGDSAVSIVLPHQPGIASALTIDLGTFFGQVRTICGRVKDGCLREPTILADNDDTYMLDYSIDGINWTTYGNHDPNTGDWHSATFPPVSGSGLRTRDMKCSARPDLKQNCGTKLKDGSVNEGPDFKARYVRIYARGGGDTYAVSELELWDSSGNRLPTTPIYANPLQNVVGGYVPYAAGPEPFYINGEFAAEGTSYNDTHWATLLADCTPTKSCPPAATGTPAPVSAAKQIDLTDTFLISRMVIQADGNDTYQVDAWDGKTLTTAGTPAWTPLWTVPKSTSSGLRTRSTRTFSTATPQARYVRFYATAGDGKYSVSELQVFTAQGNTGGNYANATSTTASLDPDTGLPVLTPQLDSQNFPWSDGRANDGKGLACSYDGTFTTKLQVVQDDGSVQDLSTLPIGFYVDSVYLNAHCDNGTQSGDYNLASATNRDCSMTLVRPVGYGGPFTDKFQAGMCASPATQAILTYMNFDEEDNSAIQFDSKDDVSPDPKKSDLTCNDFGSLDAHIPDVLRGFIPIVAADAVKKSLNGILDYHRAPNSLVPFPKDATTKLPVQCDQGLLGGPPPGPDNISGLAGTATQVGSGSDSATLKITGSFAVDQPVSLDATSLALDSLLQEVGVGELMQGPDGGTILPTGLVTQNGSKADNGKYRTPPGVKPAISALITAQGNSMTFEIDVQKATIAAPQACLTGSATASLKTAFMLVGGSTDPIQLRATSTWQCNGAKLVTP